MSFIVSINNEYLTQLPLAVRSLETLATFSSNVRALGSSLCLITVHIINVFY